MKTLLYIDPFNGNGHLNLNKVFIRTLMDRGFDVRLVVREGYARSLGLSEEMVDLIVPERYHKRNVGRWKARWGLWKTFRHIKTNLDLSRYDIVFLSAYEEMSLFLAGIGRKLYLVNHANVSGMDNPFKRAFTRMLSRQSTHIVLAEFIKDRFAHFGIKKVLVEPLGLTEPYWIDEGARAPLLRSINEKLASGRYESIIFSPSGSKYGSPLMSQIISDPHFKDYLARNKILLVVKDKALASDHPNILILRDALSQDQYQVLFTESDLIIICYPESFNYRVSASLFEAFSNRKACFLTDIEGFRFYSHHFNYNPYFRDTESLIGLIEAFCRNKEALAIEPFSDLASLTPTFKALASDQKSMTEA